MPVKPASSEDEYFVREDALKKRKLALQQARELEKKEKDDLKKLHWMRCPKCGMELHTVTFRGVDIDRCFTCHGLWLDDGELEKIAGHEKRTGTWMESVLNIFKDTKK